MGRIYSVAMTGQSVTDTGDFIQLRGGASVICKILEIRVFQTSAVDLAMNYIRIHRGTGGAAGTGLTEREWGDISGAAPGATGFSLPTTDVGTLDADYYCGWNILNEFLWLPTPQQQLVLAASDHLGVSLGVSDTLTIGASIMWEEQGV